MLAVATNPVAPPNGDVRWPLKYNLLGIDIAATTYSDLVTAVFSAVSRRVPAVVSLHAVHAVVEAARDPVLRQRVNSFNVIAPDGQPVRWALNWFYRTRLEERVYGPELMLRLCERAAEDNVSIYLYGGSPAVVEKLSQNLTAKYPALQIAGKESPPFRRLSPEEDEAMIRRINQSGAGLVFIGLGCPKQDHFAFEHANRLEGVQVCVGAAFDFHAGEKKMAPAWMQRNGLEWLFRLTQEPRRLWKRYLVTNSLFVLMCARQALRRRPPAKPEHPNLALDRVINS